MVGLRARPHFNSDLTPHQDQDTPVDFLSKEAELDEVKFYKKLQSLEMASKPLGCSVYHLQNDGEASATSQVVKFALFQQVGRRLLLSRGLTKSRREGRAPIVLEGENSSSAE